MLTKKQLINLKKDVVLNSLFLKDYSNALFIKPQTVCDFFNSYIEDLRDSAIDKTIDIYDLLEKYDSNNRLYDYYQSLCATNYDPLLQDDFKFIYNINVYYAIVIYDIDYSSIDDRVYVGMVDGNRLVKKITLNKIYCDKNDNEYIIVYKHRYYLKDFIKTSF